MHQVFHCSDVRLSTFDGDPAAVQQITQRNLPLPDTEARTVHYYGRTVVRIRATLVHYWCREGPTDTIDALGFGYFLCEDPEAMGAHGLATQDPGAFAHGALVFAGVLRRHVSPVTAGVTAQ